MSEILDPENQFNRGLKMILSAYETHTSLLSNEISRLNNELDKKNEKIKKLDELCAQLLKEKTEYELTISSLNKQICHYQTQLSTQFETLHIKNSRKSHSSKKKKKISIKENVDSSNFINDNLNDKLKENGSESFLDQIKLDKLTNSSISTIFNDYQSNNSSQYKNKNKYYKPQSRNLSSEIIKGEISNSIIDKEDKNCRRFDNKSQENEGFKNLNDSICLYGKEIKKRYSRSDIKMNSKKDGDFFKKCRSEMTPNEYSELIEIVHLFNSKQISRSETYKQISIKLREGNHPNLLNDFNSLFL